MTIRVREKETISLFLTPIATRCPSRRKLSCRLLGTASSAPPEVGLQPLNSIGFLFLQCELDNEVRSIHNDFRFDISIYLILIDRDAESKVDAFLLASLSINMR